MTKPEPIRAQEGPQELFLSTPADIAIYGGAAGGGKSFALLMEPLRHINNGKFGAVMFRRNSTQVTNMGGLWDESMKLYGGRGTPREHDLEWKFPSGMTVKFSHIEYEKIKFNWQGSQIPLICFDELTHFTESMFIYMLSRNRSDSGVPGYIRATCNPDPDSWVAKFIDWWIGADGLPIPARIGKLRWFIRVKEKIEWASSKEELYEKFGRGPDILPKSVTFIPAKLSDNKILEANDPSYRANLNALGRIDRARLLEGNWKVRATSGEFFKREWFRVVDVLPGGWTEVNRAWDRAATAPNDKNPDPDWTRGIKLFKYDDGTYCVGDLRSMRDGPGEIEKFIKNVASSDSHGVKILAQIDPGSAGKDEEMHFVRMLAGYNVSTQQLSTKKASRAKPVATYAFHGNIRVLRASWNDEFFDELEKFSENDKDYDHDDIVDALSLAFNDMAQDQSMVDVNDGLAAAFGMFSR